MSKTTKIVFQVLAAVCAVSILLNVFFVCSNRTGAGAKDADSIAVMLKKDSLKSDTIKQLKDSLAKQEVKLDLIERITKK